MHVVWEMLGDGPENIVAELVKDDDDRERFAANLYPALWAAIQLDRHLPALAITQLMSTYANPSSPTHMIEQLTALTEEILCGLGDPNRHLSADGLAHSDPVALVDVGRDADAAELLRVFATHLGTAPSRSAAEGFLLLGRTLTGPEQLTPDMINETVQRSRDFWSDQESSTFICLAASLAYLALGDPTKGREVLSYAYRTDWFIRAATAITALAEKNPSLVLSTLSRGTKLKDSPRAKAMLNVVAAAAFLQLGNPTAALRRLENLSSFEEMRLARFAFRFLTVEDFDALTEISMSLPSTLQDAFTQGARDPKVFARIASVSLTPTEYELLGLLHEGHTNSKIASIRVVSINTVRSQMRTLYKKIGAENRREAIAFAERQGIFGASVPEED